MFSGTWIKKVKSGCFEYFKQIICLFCAFNLTAFTRMYAEFERSIQFQIYLRSLVNTWHYLYATLRQSCMLTHDSVQDWITHSKTLGGFRHWLLFPMMVYCLFYFKALMASMIENEDVFSFLFQVSPQTWRRSRASLSDVSSVRDIEILSVRQLKEILARNYVNYSGCCEKWELVERVSRLFREREESRRSCGY